jgi:tetratricopeptide (TPR) repeat protein
MLLMTTVAYCIEKRSPVVVISEAPVTRGGQVVHNAQIGEVFEVIEDKGDIVLIGNWRLGWIGAHAILPPKEAASEFSRRLKLENTGDLYASVAVAFFCVDDWRHAEQYSDRSLALDPRNIMALRIRCLSRLRQRGANSALSDANSLIAIAPAHPDGYRARGHVLDAFQRYEQALADYQESIRLDPADATLYMYRANTLNRIGKRAKALEELDRAVAMNPSFCDALILRAAIRGNLGDFDGAFSDLRKVTEQYGDIPDALSACGLVRQQAGDLDGAIKEYTRCIEAGISFAYLSRGVAKRLKGDYQGATADISRAITEGLDDSDTWFQLTEANLARGDFDEVITNCNRILSLDPEYAYASHVRRSRAIAL